MKATKVCCQGCGADLRIDESIRYVTCNYCNTLGWMPSAVIHKEGNS